MRFQFTDCDGAYYLNFNAPQAEVGERRLEIEAESVEEAREKLLILLREQFERRIERIEVHRVPSKVKTIPAIWDRALTPPEILQLYEERVF